MIPAGLAALVLVALPSGAPAAGPPAVAPPPREAVLPEAGPPGLIRFEGEVTAVDGGSITVRGFHTWVRDILPDKTTIFWVGGQYHLCSKVEQTRRLLTLTLAGSGDVVRLPRDRQPARRFAAGPDLAAGRWRPTGVSARTYRLADVRVGDEVLLECRPVDGADECLAIQIDRRPGGRVPPAPGEDADEFRPWHVVANAWQDWEYRGIPLPDELDPVRGMAAQRAVWRRAQVEEARLEREAERRAPPPRPVSPPPPAYSVGPFEGVVTAVDGRAISVRGFGAKVGNAGPGGWSSKTGAERVALGDPLHVDLLDRGVVLATRSHSTREVLTLTLLNGENMIVRRADMKERRFPAGPELLAGGFDPAATPGTSYRLADVRVGDEVIAYCEFVGEVDSCRRIMIRRRPGGQVPPAPGQKPKDRDPYHEVMNAYQAYEEHGIPLPDRYDIDKVRAKGRLETVTLEREARQKREAERVAPPPRLAKPQPPAP